ncbi:MAG: hypothetical protein ACTHNT_13880 [Actinomycetales bacterium]
MTRYPRRDTAQTSTTRDGRDPQRRRQSSLFERVRQPGPLA